MVAVTYPSRALGLAARRRIGPLPAPALDYLQLVGPAVLAALAAVNIDGHRRTDAGRDRRRSTSGSSGSRVRRSASALVAWRKNLLLGLIVAAVIVVVARGTAGRRAAG